MSNKAPTDDGQTFQAVTLPVVGSTVQVTGQSLPLQGGLYRFHATAAAFIGLLDPLANVAASAADVPLGASADEYYYVPEGHIVSTTAPISLTLIP